MAHLGDLVWVIEEAAEANGVVFVSTFDVVNGSQHDEYPR
jgi:hypothetical protein